MKTQPATEGSEAPHLSETSIERVAERLADAANVRTVYGSPVDRNGTTVIPVANVRYGFGGGTGRKVAKGEAKGDEGTGGGGAVQVSPVGYIQMSDGEVKFRRIRLGPTVLRALGIGIGALLIAREVGKLVRRQRVCGALEGMSGRDKRRFVRRLKALRGG